MELYSDTKRNLKTVDIFIYDEVSKEFKNSIFNFIQNNVTNTELSQIYRKIIIEYGLKRNIKETYLNQPDIFADNFIGGFEKLISSNDEVDFYLDLIVLFLNVKNDKKEEMIVSLNKMLYKYSLGYQIDIVKDQMIRVDSKYVHKEVIQKVFILLSDSQFKNVDDEYRKAFEELKNGNYEGVLVEVSKAFESTMKIICDLKEYGLPKKHNASALIAHLRTKKFIENFQDEIFNGLDKTLQSSAIIRNHKSAHGQGSKKESYLLCMLSMHYKLLQLIFYY